MKMQRAFAGLLSGLLFVGVGQPLAAPAAEQAKVSAAVPAGHSLLYEQSFEKGDPIRDFVFTDRSAWKVTGEGKSRALELVKQSDYKPAVRSPFNIALLADRQFGDFVIEVDLLQTGREYGHRDMCLFFGLQDPGRFYYVHLATKMDDHAHNVFIVNNAPRTKISTRTTEGVNWGLEIWHRVRLERKIKEGTIRVFFDDMEKPVMEARDTTFGVGAIGFGSFDDTGKVKNIRIWGPRLEKSRTEIYQRPE
ncbi:MAG TPA: hypothetical protein DCY13_15115 [Verrucomicrobiales bacterium]|nr:hypothetical protein [Verrucomicrobiales bacterium]